MSIRLSVSVANRIMKVWLHLDCFYHWTAAYRREQEIIRYMLDFVGKIRVVKQAEFEQKQSSIASNDDGAEDDIERPPQLFINEMLKLYYRGELKLEDLDEQLITMIVGVSIDQIS